MCLKHCLRRGISISPFFRVVLGILGEQEQVITMLNNCYLVSVVYQHSTHAQSVLISTKYGNLSLLSFKRHAISTGHPGFQIMYNTTMSVILLNKSHSFHKSICHTFEAIFLAPSL